MRVLGSSTRPKRRIACRFRGPMRRWQWSAAPDTICERFAKYVADPPQQDAKASPNPSRSVTKRLLAPSDGVLVQRGPKARLQGVQVLRRPASRGMATFVTGARVSKEARALCFRPDATALQRQEIARESGRERGCQ